MGQNKILLIISAVDPWMPNFIKVNLGTLDTRKKQDFPIIRLFYAFSANESYKLITSSDLNTECDMCNVRHRIANYDFGGM
jgi:hypothetical protein